MGVAHVALLILLVCGLKVRVVVHPRVHGSYLALECYANAIISMIGVSPISTYLISVFGILV